MLQHRKELNLPDYTEDEARKELETLIELAVGLQEKCLTTAMELLRVSAAAKKENAANPFSFCGKRLTCKCLKFDANRGILSTQRADLDAMPPEFALKPAFLKRRWEA